MVCIYENVNYKMRFFVIFLFVIFIFKYGVFLFIYLFVSFLIEFEMKIWYNIYIFE